MTTPGLKKFRYNLVHDNGFIFTLLRSGASSQICGWIDMIVSFVLFAFCNLTPWLSTALGALVGGIFNCIINYRFTFHSEGLEWRAVMEKGRFAAAEQFRHPVHLLPDRRLALAYPYHRTGPGLNFPDGASVRLAGGIDNVEFPAAAQFRFQAQSHRRIYNQTRRPSGHRRKN